MDAYKQLTLWFHRRETPYALALVRMLLPLGMLIGVLRRWGHVRELFSTDGAPAPLWESYGQPDLLPILPPAGAMALYAMLTFCLVTGALGWKTRLSWLVVAVLYPYFGLADSIGTLTKYTVIATHLALLLAVSGAGQVWSIDALLNSVRGSRPPRVAVWPQRLVQLFICLVYLGAASTKLHTTGYFQGEQLYYWMLTNVNYPNPLGEWVSQYSLLLIVGSYLTVLWEVLFPFLVWRRPWRSVMLGTGLVFHVMTYFLLGLFVFPLIYLAAYPAFLRNDEALRFGNWCTGLGNRLTGWTQTPLRTSPWFSQLGGAVSFGTLLLLFSALSVTAEARMDVYGQDGSGGPIVLQPLSGERAREILRNDTIVRPRDKVFSFHIGTTIVGDVLTDRRREYRHGERLIAQCRLIRPHEDLWLETSLHDSRNRIIERAGDIVPREEIRASFAYALRPSLEPGEYFLAVRLDGQEVARRRFILHGQHLGTAHVER